MCLFDNCTPLPIDKIKTYKEVSHHPNKAGYIVIEYYRKLSQCPKCDAEYTYGDKTPTGRQDFISYEKT